MKTNVTNYYDLLAYGLGNSSFQSFVDKFQQKYNALNTEGFGWDPEIQLDYTYEQLIASLGIVTLPNYVDADAEALDKSLGEWKVGSNKIPTQKHRYGMNTRILRERMVLLQRFGESTLNQEAKNAILDLLFESTDKLLAGNRNALTHQRMQIVSTGQFQISAANNARGITGITFDFGVSDKTTLTAAKKWYTKVSGVLTANSSADPIADMKDKIKARRKLGKPTGKIEMSADLFDLVLAHPTVLSRIGYSIAPVIGTASDAVVYAKNMAEDAQKQALERLVGCPIVVQDTQAMQEVFSTNGITHQAVENFDAKNISFLPQGEIGTIKSVRPLVFTEDPTQNYAWFDGGRTLITQRFDAKTRSMYVESEMATLCVPNAPQYMSIITVTD